MDPVTQPDPTFFGFPAPTQRRAVLAALALYVAGFVTLWPNAVLVSDEAHYIGQAVMFARGEATRPFRDVLAGTTTVRPLSTYPVGTSALQAPFVKLGGWRAAHLVSLFALIGTVLLLLRWMAELARPPVFALLPLLFIGTLVPGRLAMSDSVTALLSTGTLFLFWRGTQGRPYAWLGAGLLAGLTAVFRDATPVLFTPLFAATLLRREWKLWQLVVGGFAGLSVRFIGAKLLFGSFLFARQVGDAGHNPFDLAGVPPNVVLFAAIVVLALPLGLPSLFLFRDARKPELLVSVLVMLAVYIAVPLPHGANSWVRDIVVHARYASALVPLAAYALSEWIPRLLAARPAFQKGLVAAATGGAVVASIVVHVMLWTWGGALARITATIYEKTPENSVFLTSMMGASKFLGEAFGHREALEREDVPAERVAALVAAGEPVYVVFVDRTDAEWRRIVGTENQAYLDDLRTRCTVEPLVDRQEPTGERLTIAKLAVCPSR